jgi:hypothetical protein
MKVKREAVSTERVVGEVAGSKERGKGGLISEVIHSSQRTRKAPPTPRRSNRTYLVIVVPVIRHGIAAWK